MAQHNLYEGGYFKRTWVVPMLLIAAILVLLLSGLQLRMDLFGEKEPSPYEYTPQIRKLPNNHGDLGFTPPLPPTLPKTKK